MSTLTALARAQAVVRGVAQPVATVRHLHVSDRPLVFVPLALAGEANAPLAAMVGTAREAPTLLVVPQPRDRAQRFAFAAALADVVVPYVDSFRGAQEAVAVDRGRDVRYRYVDAPQLLVPNPGGVDFVRLLGRSTRFRRADGDHPVPPAVPLLGRWLTFFAERTEQPGSSALVAATDALALHWASGQSHLEDLNLAALLGWIDPPPGMTGAQAAARAEDPALWPPAGPATDPTFDNDVLAPLVQAYSSGDAPALAALEDALRGQLEPTWRLMWRTVDLLRTLPAGARVAKRFDLDRDAYTAFTEHVDAGGPPQPRRDHAVSAAIRLHRLERAHAAYAAQRALDDPLVMAEHRMSGEAFAGTVVMADPTRVDDSGKRRVLRPRIMVRTTDPVRLEAGVKLTAPSRPEQTAQVVFVRPAGVEVGLDVVVELTGGLGRSLTPPEGAVPEVGEWICYSSVRDAYQPSAPFPEDTPWTHGGPPAEYVPTPDDTGEDWS